MPQHAAAQEIFPRDRTCLLCALIGPIHGAFLSPVFRFFQKFMQRVDMFLQRLVSFDKDNIPATHIAALKPYLAKPDFTASAVASKSFAAAGLCDWVINIDKYHHVHCFVQPKRELVEDSKAKLEIVNREVTKIKTAVARLQSKLSEVPECAHRLCVCVCVCVFVCADQGFHWHCWGN